MSSWIQRREGTTSLLTLMRPSINALGWEALNELTGAVEKVEADRETRVLVITSGIEGIFCSGGDLNFWRQVRDGKEVSRAGREVFAQIERLPKPTIAAINGHVIGDGLNLALACDLRIASEAASIRLPEAAYGFIPGWGLIQRLVTLIGRSNASGLLLPGQQMEATQAWMVGLVNEAISSHRLMDEVLARAREIAAFSPTALRAVKCVLSLEEMKGRVLRLSGAMQTGKRGLTLYSLKEPRYLVLMKREVRDVISIDVFRQIELQVGEILTGY